MEPRPQAVVLAFALILCAACGLQFAYGLPYALLLGLLATGLLLGLWLRGRDAGWAWRLLGLQGEGETSEAPACECSGVWALAGFLVLALALGLLEFMQPCYFTQDDNLAQFLPVIVEGCRSLAA